MNHLCISRFALLAQVVAVVGATALYSQEPDLATRSDTEERGGVETTKEATLAKVADYMARRALEGHIAFDTDEIKAATGVDVEGIDEQVLQQAVLARLAELRTELPAPDGALLAEQKNLITLDSFDQFVGTFEDYDDVPRIVPLLSPT